MAANKNRTTKFGRNDPCSCGSQKKYKNCCMGSNSLSLASPKFSQVQINAILDSAYFNFHQGQLHQAEQLCRQVLDVSSRNFEAMHLLGLLFHRSNDLTIAEAWLTKALEIDPNNAEAHCNIATVKEGLGKLNDARWHFERAISLNSVMIPALNNYANLLHKHDRNYQKSKLLYEKVLKIDPNFTMGLFNLSNLFKDIGNYELSKDFLLKAYELDSCNAKIVYALGNVLFDEAKFNEAIEHYQRALSLAPDFAIAHNSLGIAFKKLSNLDSAVNHYIQAKSISPSQISYHADAFLTMQYSENIDDATLNRHYDIFRNIFEVPRQSIWMTNAFQKSVNTPLNIGYVSSDFRFHAVSAFMLPVIKNHNHEKFKLHAYYNNQYKDAITERYIELFDCWHDCALLSDEDLAKKIREDNIDVLVDLSGYTLGNRLLTFMLKPAPLQISWMGYLGTLGLKCFDYRITDKWLEPISGHITHEKPYVMPKLWYTYAPCFKTPNLINSPSVAVKNTPALQNGYITLGCLNNISKVTHEVIGLWSDVLLKIPNSKLLLVTEEIQILRDYIKQAFASHGVYSDKLVFLNFKNDCHFELYHHIDLILDPFPYNGGTTTCDGLWMGVPFVSLEGNTVRGRMGLTLANNLGYPEWVCKNKEDYVKQAAQMVKDIKQLNELRLSLRKKMEKSALMDAQIFTQDYEFALQKMWSAR
jgi:predicted O-linked N-acetylglucosamine transferase (SPINDLY family)